MVVEPILLLLDTQLMVVVKEVVVTVLGVDLKLEQLVALVVVVLLVTLIVKNQVVRVMKVALTLLRVMVGLLAKGTFQHLLPPLVAVAVVEALVEQEHRVLVVQQAVLVVLEVSV